MIISDVLLFLNVSPESSSYKIKVKEMFGGQYKRLFMETKFTGLGCNADALEVEWKSEPFVKIREWF